MVNLEDTMNRYPQRQQQTKVYENDTPKEKVKNDFHLLLNEELKKYHIDLVV